VAELDPCGKVLTNCGDARDVRPDLESVNGKMDSERAKMLIDELDTLDEPKDVKDDVGKEGGSEADVDFDSWELMDCTFGIPLFNAKLNREICERICSYEVGKSARYTIHLVTN
jgi:hypothetical protein